MQTLKQHRAQWLQSLMGWSGRIVLLSLIFLVIGFFWRLAFLMSYGDWQELRELPLDLFKAFFLGARFDLTVLAYVNAIPFLFFWLCIALTVIPAWARWGKTLLPRLPMLLTAYYTLTLFLINMINIIDLHYYSFYLDRINVLIFGFFKDDTVALVKTMWKNYPVVWLFGGLFVATALLFVLLRRFFKRPVPTSPLSLAWPVSFALFFCIFLLNGVVARGSLGLFPLSEMDTGISGHAFINQLGFNSSRALARAIELKNMQQSHWDSNLKAFGYGENYRQAFADYYGIPVHQVPEEPLQLIRHKTGKNLWAEKNKPHVLLLVMESFGSYWLDYNSPEFDLLGDLKTHFDQDTYIKNFMSSTGATIGSLSSLMIGSMQRTVSEFLTESEYMQVPFRSSPARIFKSAGYKARFVYGGNTGWREIDKFARFQGFDTVEGESEISKALGGSLKEKHDWGIYDEDMWNYIWDSLQNASQPQFILGMTTTNHPPYQLPSTYQQPELKIPEALKKRLIGDPSLPPKRFATYRYSTQKLAELLSRIKNSPLKDRVIVAVTGDHTFWIVNFSENEFLQKSAVPFYLYVPSAVRHPFKPNSFGSHPDILPTLYEAALSEVPYDSVSESLFKANRKNYALDHNQRIVGASGGILIGHKDNYFAWLGDYEKLLPSEGSEEHQKMARHYRSLMGVLDYYLMREKQLSKPELLNENPRR